MYKELEFFNDDDFETYLLEKEDKEKRLVDAVNINNDYLTRIRCLANYWKGVEDKIIEQGRKNRLGWFDSYAMDYQSLFTPIETEAWSAIRYYAGVPFYPQYPVGNYICDFGNPVHKLAIELDGKEHHDSDIDNIRDGYIDKMGWTVIRITGRDMVKDCKTPIDAIPCYFSDSDRIDVYNEFYNTGWGIFRSLRKIYTNELFYDMTEFRFAISFLMKKVTAGGRRLLEIIEQKEYEQSKSDNELYN